MDDQEYIKERVDDQIGWYDKKGMHNQSGTKSSGLRNISLANDSFSCGIRVYI